MTAERSLLLDLESCVAPAHCAVVVIDMQNDFCAPGGWTETVVKKDISSCKPAAEATQNLVAAARAAGVPVLWVRADYSPERLPAPMQARNQRMGMTQVCCAPGTWGADWYVVRPAPGEAVLTKHCFSGFMGTHLDGELRKRGVRSIVFAGVQSHVCVESTLRDAHSHGYYCVVAQDCVASHTPPAHEVMLANARFLFGEVSDSASLAEIWKRG